MTLRTVFGDEPRSSIELASRSTSRVVTAATFFFHMAGEMWTRCIDSQFWRYESRAPSMAIRSRSRSAAWSTVTSSRTGLDRPRASRLLSLDAPECLLGLRDGEPVGLAALALRA